MRASSKWVEELTEAWWPIWRYGDEDQIWPLGVAIAEAVVVGERIVYCADVLGAQISLGLTRSEALGYASSLREIGKPQALVDAMRFLPKSPSRSVPERPGD